MEHITIRIQTTGAAFDSPAEELARILRELADRLDHAGGNMPDVSQTLRDINGNTCGTVTIEG